METATDLAVRFLSPGPTQDSTNVSRLLGLSSKAMLDSNMIFRLGLS